MNSGGKWRGSAGRAFAKAAALEEERGVAELERSREDQDAKERAELRSKRAQRRRRRIGTQPAMLVLGMAVMVMRGVDCEWRVGVGVGADDNRRHSTLETGHIPGRPEQAQSKQQREQRRA